MKSIRELFGGEESDDPWPGKWIPAASWRVDDGPDGADEE